MPLLADRFNFPRPTIAGRLNFRFAFDKRISIDDGFGNKQGDWQEQFKIWSAKKYLTGGENVVAARLSGLQPVLLTVRTSTLTKLIETHWRCRDLSTGEIFNIKNVRSESDREGYMDILVQHDPAEG